MLYCRHVQLTVSQTEWLHYFASNRISILIGEGKSGMRLQNGMCHGMQSGINYVELC